MVRVDEVEIKVETNLVLRGSVFDPQIKGLCSEAQNVFEVYAKIQTLSDADIYGGKICAALDRQHPRDLFDVMLLLNSEGITEDTSYRECEFSRMLYEYRNWKKASSSKGASTLLCYDSFD